MAIIPFVNRLAQAERDSWLLALNKAIPSHRVKTLNDLSTEEKDAAKVAIVANPNPLELSSLSNLEWVQSLWAGVENLLAASPESPFQIVRMTDPQLAETMAEAVLAWTLYLHRDMPRYRAQQMQQIWQQQLLRLPRERRVAVLGLGQLGKLAAKKLKENGFSVCGWSRSKTELQGIDTFHGLEQLDLVLAQSDMVVILLPLTSATRGILNLEMLQKLPKGASLINFSRGAVLVENDLLKCLDEDAIDHAVLDVFELEPLPVNHRFWLHPKITVLPHISSPTNQQTACNIVSLNIENYFSNGLIPQSINRINGY